MKTYQNRISFPVAALAVVSLAAIVAVALLSHDPKINIHRFFGGAPPQGHFWFS